MPGRASTSCTAATAGATPTTSSSKPGVDPDDIVFTFAGYTSLAVNGNGELETTTALGTIIWPEPTLSSYDATGTSYTNSDTPAYSVVGSNKVEITGVNSVSNRYLVIGGRSISRLPAGMYLIVNPQFSVRFIKQ